MSSRIGLELLEVRKPCPANWDDMAGDGPVRFCEHCQKRVHDLSAMPRDAAERLVCQNAGRLCVRLAYAADGSVISLDYRPQKRRQWTWRVWTLVALAGALMTGTVEAVFLGRRIPVVVPTPPPQQMPVRMILGDIAPCPTPAPTPSQSKTSVEGRAG
jgi:hypothetical protein